MMEGVCGTPLFQLYGAQRRWQEEPLLANPAVDALA